MIFFGYVAVIDTYRFYTISHRRKNPMDKSENQLYRFWAKTTDDKKNPQRQNAFHPLICHLIDVAASAQMLWSDVLPMTIKKRLANIFQFKENEFERAGKLIAFLIGLHDLGKCSPPFVLRGGNDNQNNQTFRLLELYQDTEYFCDGFKTASEAPHNFVTSVVLPPILEEKFQFKTLLAKNISDIIGGHHGTFPDSNFLTKKTGDDYCGNQVWRDAQKELVETLAGLFEIEGDFSHLPNQKLDNAAAMIFAGLTTTADWIGSNADFFKCEVEDSRNIATFEKNFSVKRYFEEKSKPSAEKALKILGWTNWAQESNEKSFDLLFPNIGDKRHLQIVAEKIVEEKELDAVGIAVVESPMGEGKTEAAMFLADAWNAKLGTRGIYFALPTQATSNQMFGRVEEFLGKKFAGEDVNVQLMLQHGHSSISAEFEEKIENFRNIQNISDDADKKGFSNIAAAEWFTYKKRGLLVPFGVGTVDQILLAALQTKHVFVRLFGLAHKTIIIDEVHAYDAYMSTLLERLLEWLAALGSPVVILSATLPQKKRDALIRAYLKGLGKAADGDEIEKIGERDVYPRISYATAAMSDKTFKICQLKTSDQNTKTLHLEWKNEDNFVEDLKLKLANGGCAAIICNTVDKAQTLYAQLKDDDFFKGDASDNLPKLDLLHARFRFKNRDEREKRSLERFGKPDENDESPHRPKMAVLISTQIIEQSLDLDFDLMISEPAPADLLLQRAGRLQRHNRERLPEFENKPTLWIIKPPTDTNGELLTNEKGLPDFGKSGVVYDKHILLRSWLKLRHEKEIEIPGGIEKLIEDVYNKKRECFDEKYLNVWNESKTVSDKKLAEKRFKAKAVFLTDFDDDDFYDSFNFQLDEDDPEKHQTLRAQTRDEERPTVAVVLLTQEEAKSVNLNIKPDRETSEFLIKREVKISRSGLTQAILANPDFKKSAWEKSALLRHHRLIILNEDKQILVGNTTIVLDDEKGVEYKTKGGNSE